MWYKNRRCPSVHALLIFYTYTLFQSFFMSIFVQFIFFFGLHILVGITFTYWSGHMAQLKANQKKALRIMNLQSRDSHSSPLFRSNHILKREDKILADNIISINKSFNNLPRILKIWFTSCSDLHSYHSLIYC